MRKKKYIKTLLEAGSYLAISLLIVWGLPRFLGFVLKTDYPLAVVTSNSMWPTLKTGDLVLIKGADKNILNVSDIAVYEHENGFAIHRVIDKGQEVFVTKGDANVGQGEQVYYDQLIGKAVTIGNKPIKIPYLGSIGSFIKNKIFS